MLEAKVKPFIQDIDNAVLPEPILIKPQNQEKVSLFSVICVRNIYWLCMLPKIDNFSILINLYNLFYICFFKNWFLIYV